MVSAVFHLYQLMMIILLRLLLLLIHIYQNRAVFSLNFSRNIYKMLHYLSLDKSSKTNPITFFHKILCHTEENIKCAKNVSSLMCSYFPLFVGKLAFILRDFNMPHYFCFGKNSLFLFCLNLIFYDFNIIYMY